MPQGQYAVADAKPLGEYHVDDVEPASEPSSNGGLVLAGAAKAIPVAADLAEHIVTSPSTVQLAAKAGRVIGALSPVVAGASAGAEVGGIPGAVLGAITSVPAMAKGAWIGGRTGYFTGKGIQNISAPIANALEAAKPYAQTLSTLGGAQSVLDLAQMAAPDRRDIGFLGMSNNGGQATPTLKEPRAQVQAVQYLIDAKGLTPSEAVKHVTGNDVRLFGPLLTLYMRSRMK